MTSINFPNNAAFVGNRPYADIILHPGQGNSAVHKCLVDTGADYLQLPARAATAIGLSLHQASSFQVNTAGGTVSNLLLMHQVPVSIEGYIVTVDVLFDPSNTALPLAGRNILLAAFDIGFQPSTWHWT